MTELFAMFETDHEVDPKPAPVRLDDWESSISGLTTRFPGVKIGTLFCIYKVQLDRDVEFRDVLGEAGLRDIPLSGRSMHQAKVLLGIEAPRPRAPRRSKDAETVILTPGGPVVSPAEPAPTAAALDVGSDIETLLRGAVESAVAKATENYRVAIHEALALIQDALAHFDAKD